MKLLKTNRAQTALSLIVVLTFIVGWFVLYAQTVKQRRWQFACAVVDRLNDPIFLRNLRATSSDNTLEPKLVLSKAGILPSEFLPFEESAASIRIVILPILPPPGEPISAAVEGDVIYPELLPEWKLSRDLIKTIR